MPRTIAICTHKGGTGKTVTALAIPLEQGACEVPLDHVEPDPKQPRKTFDKDELEHLASSIRENGVLQPIIVYRPKGSTRYRIIAGERRYRAARLAGLETVPCLEMPPDFDHALIDQLAYHLDTWVIKVVVDQMPKPIPRLIRIGDLRSIARQLNHGGDTNAVKRAFEQNASAFIRARVRYKTSDGAEELLEGFFNRYNVFYRGQKLPGGRRAETVYISLNDPYYDLISREVRVTQRRRRMQIQMAAIHRPRLESEYVARVSYDNASVDDGALDWIIRYVPGARARSEFRTFNGPRQARLHRRTQPPLPGAGPAPRGAAPTRPLRQAKRSASKAATELARRFAAKRYGSAATEPTRGQIDKAQQLLKALDGDLNVAQAAVDLAAQEGRDHPKGFPAHLAGVLEGGYHARARDLQAKRGRRQAAAARAADSKREREEYKAWCRARAADRIADLGDNGRQRLVDERLPQLVAKYRGFLRIKPGAEQRVHQWARRQVLQAYGREGEPSFDEWKARHASGSGNESTRTDPTNAPTG